jgi:hypothetical protein
MCSHYNEEQTRECLHLPKETKVPEEAMVNHFTETLAEADFRRRWVVMVKEIVSLDNLRFTMRRFNNPHPTPIELFLNYRLGNAFYTFGERHPEMFISEEEREIDAHDLPLNKVTDTKLIFLINLYGNEKKPAL